MIRYPLKQLKFVNRIDYLKSLCANKRVLHLGATDAPETINAVVNNRFLHAELEKVSSHVTGMDICQEMINWLASNHNVKNIVYGDIEQPEDYPKDDFDIVIAGEILEHLNNPGHALKGIFSAMKATSILIITVPNAYSLKGFCRALLKHELIHPDHTVHYSPHTLKILLERHGFVVKESFGFTNGGKGIAAFLANQFLRVNPQVAEGIGMVCTINSL